MKHNPAVPLQSLGRVPYSWAVHSECRLQSSAYRVRTDPGKVWKVLEFNVKIFKALKSLENDHRYGKVWKILENCNVDLENTVVCYTVDCRCIC